MTSNSRYDVVVIGAGIVGASCAHHLAGRGLSVAVVESNSGHAEGSTGLSFASVRAQWADPLNIELSWRGVRRYRDFENEHGIDIGYRPTGYLLLIPEALWDSQLKAVELQQSHGVPVEVLDIAKAQAITPFAADGIAGATWGPADGQIDPHGTTGAYLELSKRQGATVRFNFPVDGIQARGDGSWVVSAGDRSIEGQWIVNAAGGWAGEIAALAGLEVPVVHSRRNIYATAEGALHSAVPMTIDCGSGVYLRSEGGRLLFAAARPGETDGYNTAVDWPWMEEVLMTGTQRFPWLADLPLDRGACWAGTYENTPDQVAVVGADPGAETWINACGFSGHGLMQAPEVGRLVAEQVRDGAITSLDISPLAIDRFRSNKASNESLSLVF